MLNKKVLQYIEADAKEKDALTIKKGLRDYLGKLLRRCRRLGIELNGISYSEEERYKFNDGALYEWVKDRVDPETLEYLTQRSIDLDKLHNLYLEGKIDTSTIAEDVFSVTKYFKITVNHKKVDNKWQKKLY